MKILFDTNVVLDVLLSRNPHDEFAIKLFRLMDSGKIDGVLCATTVTTIEYIVAKDAGRKHAMDCLRDLLDKFQIAPVDLNVLSQALSLDFSDYEDAVIHEAARMADASLIVSRDRNGFAKGSLPVYSPAELLASRIDQS